MSQQKFSQMLQKVSMQQTEGSSTSFWWFPRASEQRHSWADIDRFLLITAYNKTFKLIDQLLCRKQLLSVSGFRQIERTKKKKFVVHCGIIDVDWMEQKKLREVRSCAA